MDIDPRAACACGAIALAGVFPASRGIIAVSRAVGRLLWLPLDLLLGDLCRQSSPNSDILASLARHKRELRRRNRLCGVATADKTCPESTWPRAKGLAARAVANNSPAASHRHRPRRSELAAPTIPDSTSSRSTHSRAAAAWRPSRRRTVKRRLVRRKRTAWDRHLRPALTRDDVGPSRHTPLRRPPENRPRRPASARWADCPRWNSTTGNSIRRRTLTWPRPTRRSRRGPTRGARPRCQPAWGRRAGT